LQLHFASGAAGRALDRARHRAAFSSSSLGLSPNRLLRSPVSEFVANENLPGCARIRDEFFLT
jgi:hypothetical protein